MELEVPYIKSNGSNGYIDIVLACGEWFILIENKIRHESKTANQIKDEYSGFCSALKEKEICGKKILLIYLVPAINNNDKWQTNDSFESEIQDVVDGNDVAVTIY